MTHMPDIYYFKPSFTVNGPQDGYWRKPSLAALFDKLIRPTHTWYNKGSKCRLAGEAPDALRGAKPPPPPHDVQQVDSKAGTLMT